MPEEVVNVKQARPRHDALDADAASAALPEGSAEGAEAAASQWAAMADEGANFMQSAKGGAERILNQERPQEAKSMACMKNIHWGSAGGNGLPEYPPQPGLGRL